MATAGSWRSPRISRSTHPTDKPAPPAPFCLSWCSRDALDLDLDISARDAHVVARDVAICRCAKDLSRSDIKPCTMPRASHLVTLDVTLGQWPFLMGASGTQSSNNSSISYSAARLTSKPSCNLRS